LVFFFFGGCFKELGFSISVTITIVGVVCLQQFELEIGMRESIASIAKIYVGTKLVRLLEDYFLLVRRDREWNNNEVRFMAWRA
jgi:hypothetical protein